MILPTHDSRQLKQSAAFSGGGFGNLDQGLGHDTRIKDHVEIPRSKLWLYKFFTAGWNVKVTIVARTMWKSYCAACDNKIKYESHTLPCCRDVWTLVSLGGALKAHGLEGCKTTIYYKPGLGWCHNCSLLHQLMNERSKMLRTVILLTRNKYTPHWRMPESCQTSRTCRGSGDR
jgi:hypothetical protein